MTPRWRVLPALLLLLLLLARRPVAAADDDEGPVLDGYPMAVGDKVKLILEPNGDNAFLKFGLCSPRTCTGIGFHYKNIQGNLQYRNIRGEMAASSESASTNQIGAAYSTASFTGPKGFDKSRNHTLAVERTSWHTFDCLVQGDPAFRVSVDTKPDESLLQWASFVGSIHLVPDKAPASRSRSADGIAVEPGQAVRVRLETNDNPHGFGIFVGMCSESSCDVVRLFNVNDEPRLAYAVLRSKTNAVLGPSDTIRQRTGPEGQFAANRNYTLLVQRSGGAMTMAVEGSPKSAISVDTDNGVLRVNAWGAWVYFHRVKTDTRGALEEKFGAACGVAKRGALGLVVNGDSESIESVPWHAALYLQRGSAMEFICGGALVAPSVVLTAAHCVARETGQPVQGKVFVGLGKTLSGWSDEDWDTKVFKSEVRKIHIHKWYRGRTTKLLNDIAVLELKSTPVLSGTIFPICLDDSLTRKEDESIKVSGWGNGSTPLTELASVKIKYVSRDECKSILELDGALLNFVTEDKFCSYRVATDKGSQGLVNGDSGSGAIVKRGRAWFLRGITSGLLTTKRDGQEVDVYTFTDVDKHRAWLAQFITW